MRRAAFLLLVRATRRVRLAVRVLLALLARARVFFFVAILARKNLGFINLGVIVLGMAEMNRRQRREWERQQKKVAERRKKEIERRKELEKRLPKSREMFMRWKRMYAEKNRFRRFMAPAYNEAVAPVIAGAINFLHKPTIRILVVAGGTGVFSRDLLPAIKKILSTHASPPKIEVVESDFIAGVVKAAPREHRRVVADMEKLPFKSGQFDLVIGQSMLHQGDMNRSIPEIGRVLTPDGYFMHVMDDAPMFKGLPPHLLGKGDALTPASKDIAKQAGAIRTAAISLAHAIAARNGLSIAAVGVEYKGIFPASKTPRLFNQDMSRYNHVSYLHGGISVGIDPKIPPGKRELQYQGVMNIMSRSRTRPLLETLGGFG